MQYFSVWNSAEKLGLVYLIPGKQLIMKSKNKGSYVCGQIRAWLRILKIDTDTDFRGGKLGLVSLWETGTCFAGILIDLFCWNGAWIGNPCVVANVPRTYEYWDAFWLQTTSFYIYSITLLSDSIEKCYWLKKTTSTAKVTYDGGKGEGL